MRPPLLPMLGLLVGLAGFIQPAGSYDLGLHLRLGQEIAESRALPAADRHSYTADGAPFTAHEWLAQLALYAAHRAVGMTGLSLLAAAVAAGAFLALYRTMPGETGLRLLALLAALPFAANHFGVRPHVLGWLLLALLLLALSREGRPWRVPLLLVLWASLHASAPLGAGLAALHYAERFSASRRRAELGWAAACLLAPLANPHGAAVYAHPFAIRAAAAFLDEWKPYPWTSAYAWGFAALVALAAVRLGPSPLAALRLVALAALGFSARRHAAVAALALAPVLAGAWAGAFPALSRRLGRGLGVLLAAGMAVWLAGQVRDRQALRAGLSQERLPVRAVEVLMASDAEPRLFNDYNFGGWLLWRAWPRFPVFIDGRTDLYQGGVIADCLKVSRAEPGWEETLERHGARTVLIRRDRPLVSALLESPGWELAYFDRLAALFVATGSAPGLRRIRNAAPSGPRAPARLEELADELGYLLGLDEGNFDLRLSLASVYALQGKRDEARRELARYLAIHPAGRDLSEVGTLLTALGDSRPP